MNLSDPTTTDATAQREAPDARPYGCDVYIASGSNSSQRRSNDLDSELLADPNMDLIDFHSDEGFFQAAGKKKKKQTTAFNWADNNGDKDGDDGQGEGGEGNNDQNGGDAGPGDGSGNSGGDGGDKGDEDKKDEAVNDDDIWSFEPAGSKKKNKKKSSDAADAFGLPDVPSADFHEIKLDDGGGGEGDDLDLGLLPKAEKITAGLTAWTSSWTTGSWGWGGLKSPGGSDIPKPVEEEKPNSPDRFEDNPWGINRGKPKKKTTTTFSFGSFEESEPQKEESFDFLGARESRTKEEPLNFLGTSKPKEKKDVGGFSWGVPAAKTVDNDFWGSTGDKTSTDDKPTEEDKSADVEASDDIWGFSSAKKDKKKKSKIAIVEETSITEEALPEAPDPPQTASPVDNAVSEAEAALIAEEEAELRKLQTKKDIGSKLTKKQQDRFRVLTENAKVREEVAAGAAEAQAGQPTAVDGLDPLDILVSDEPAPFTDIDPSQAEADEKALIVQEEEDEIYILRLKKKLKKGEKDRLRILEERADDRARAAEDAATTTTKEQVEAVPEVVNHAEPPSGDHLDETAVDAAQAEADQYARVIHEEEAELAELRAKKKLKKGDKDRLRILEERAEDRAREVEHATANSADQSVPERTGDVTESKADETVATSFDGSFGGDYAAQVETDEAAQLIEEEELEIEILLSKIKLKKADKARLKELQDNRERRERKATDEAAAEPEAFDTIQPSPADDAPAGGSPDAESPPSIEEDDVAARIIEEEEMELELLLLKAKLKKTEKARLKILQDNKAQREWEAVQKTEIAAEVRPAEDVPTVEERVSEEAPKAKAALEEDVEAARKAAEEEELSDLLAKAKLKKSEKARLKELQDRKDQRELEAAQTVETAAEAPVAEDSLAVEAMPQVLEDTLDHAEKEKDALFAAEEKELLDLVSKVKLKKSEKMRLKELQDRKDKRDEDVRLAAEKAEEEDRLGREQAEREARELEEQEKREEKEKLAAEVAAEEAEISSLESKKKLKKSEKERLADLKFRRDERASAEAAKLADDLMKEDAEIDANTKDDGQPLSWADDDPAKDHGTSDDWMDWGGLTSSSKSKKSKEESVANPQAVNLEPQTKPEEEDSWAAYGTTGKKDKKKKGKGSNLIDFGGTDDTPAVLDPPIAVPEPSGFDFGWSKPAKGESPGDNWDFGSNSKKKKSKDAAAEVVEDTNLASTVTPDPVSATKDKCDDDFWSTFGSKKSKDKKSSSSSKDDLVAQPPLPSPSPVGMDLTATEEGDIAGYAWGELGGTTELSKSKSSDKENNKPSSSKEPKLSKKELEKIEKDKKKAEREQKAREEQAAKDAAELAKLEEEERLEAEAKAEEERHAQEEADRIRKEEEEKQAALVAIAKEEADLAMLQAKKDSGKKLLKKEKEKFDKLSASCQARAEEKAAQEAVAQAARDEAERLQREAEEQARQEAIEKEESELRDLQKKKDSGRKLLKKDKDRYEMLSASKKARRQAEKDIEAANEAQAAKEHTAAADDAALDDPLAQDLAKLNANQLDELDAFLSAPPKVALNPKATEVDPFSFWGASKKPTSSSKKDKSWATEPVSLCNPREPQHISFPQPQLPTCALALASISSQSAAAEIAHAESSSSYKLLEATTRASGGTTDKARDDVATGGAGSSARNDTLSSCSQPPVVEQANHVVQHDEPPPAEPMKRKSGVPKSKIADRLKAFEAVPPPPPPPPPLAAPVEEIKTKRKSKKVDIPGSFPDEYDEGHPDDIIEVIEMPVRSKKSSSKKSSRVKADDAPIPIPPPPPAVPDAPISPLPEVKKEGKKERPKINREGGSSWGTWTASTPRDKDKKTSKSKSMENPKTARKEQSPEKEGQLSAKESSSDKAERAEKRNKDKDKSKDMAKDVDTPRPKLKSIFASTPPISRSASTRDKRHKEGRSSRRPSVDITSSLASPPSEEMPEEGSKAAKVLGIGASIGLGRSTSKRKNSSRPAEDEDIVIVDAADAESPEKSSRRRASKVRFSNTLDRLPRLYADSASVQSYHHDDDVVMIDVADATPAPGLKRSNTTGSTRKGFGGLFGGLLSKPPAEPKRRNTYHTDGEDAGAATGADAEARKAARRARRVEREVAEKAKDEIRREKRRKQEDEADAQRQADKDARRAERRAARERETDNRKVHEDKDERRQRKRAEREKEREALETGVEDDEAEARRTKRERRKVRVGESDRENEEDHRRRRAEKRSVREAEGKIPTRRRTEPVDDDFVYPRPTKISRRHTEGLHKAAAKTVEPPAWPHSGTSSWVKDHSDAGPPPDDGGMTTEAPDDGDGEEDAARRERRRRRRYGDFDAGGDGEKRKKRHEERSDGSDERRKERKVSMFADGVGAGRGSGGFGGLWKKLTRN